MMEERPNHGTRNENQAVAIVVPMLNEATELATLHGALSALLPQPDEIIIVDGGSTDGSVEMARSLGFEVIEPDVRGRAIQINRGIDHITSPLVMVVHADSVPPQDAITIIRRTLAETKTSLGGFTAILCNSKRICWLTSFHNWIKTWYVPILFRPLHFFRGGRLLFGDHAMFFRRRDFLSFGGCDESLLVMEDADLCLKFTKLGRTRLMKQITKTSDRRVAKWGGLKANLMFIFIGMLWGFGFRHYVSRLYPNIRHIETATTPL